MRLRNVVVRVVVEFVQGAGLSVVGADGTAITQVRPPRPRQTNILKPPR
jgi:hypothetical protein